MERAKTPLSNLIGFSPEPGKYTQGCREVVELTVNRQGRDFGRPTAVGLASGATSPRSDALLEEQRQALLRENFRKSRDRSCRGCRVLERGHGAA